jgi:hypothetical protein
MVHAQQRFVLVKDIEPRRYQFQSSPTPPNIIKYQEFTSILCSSPLPITRFRHKDNFIEVMFFSFMQEHYFLCYFPFLCLSMFTRIETIIQIDTVPLKWRHVSRFHNIQMDVANQSNSNRSRSSRRLRSPLRLPQRQIPYPERPLALILPTPRPKIPGTNETTE